MIRQGAVALAVAMLVVAGCSDDGGGLQGSATPSTTEASTTPTTVAGATTTSSVLASSVATTIARPPSTTAPPGTSGSSVTTAVAGGPAVAEAGGWRLVVSRPTARATIPPAAVVCYEATGSSREPELELEVTALPPGTTVRVGAQVGRGTARVDLTAAGAGGRDLRIQLVVNGQRIDGLAVTIPVTIAAGAPPGAC